MLVVIKRKNRVHSKNANKAPISVLQQYIPIFLYVRKQICLLIGTLFFSLVSNSFAFSQVNTLPTLSTHTTEKRTPEVQSDKHLSRQRTLFIRAEKAIKLGRYTQYRKLEKKLLNYPLYPYLRFIELERNLRKSSQPDIQSFIQIYHRTPLAKKLYYRWINSLAKQGKYETLVRVFRPTQNVNLLCQYANALHQTNKVKNAFSLIDEIWQTGKSLPKSCDVIIKAWADSGYMTPQRIWMRIHLAMNKGNRRLAAYLGKSLDKKQRKILSLWRRIQRKPENVLHLAQYFTEENATTLHWIMVDGMSRLSRRKPLIAAQHWENMQKQYDFKAEEKERIERNLTLSLARAATPLSRATLQSLELDTQQTRFITPHILSAIDDKDWQSALDWLNRLKNEEQSSERWGYWRARSLEEMGRLDEARSLYLQLTRQRTYYSFLAADRIGNRYQLTHYPLNAPATELSQLRHIPSVARAGELYLLKRMVEARREWHFAIQSMDKKQLLMAAQLANKWGWHDRSIITLALAQHWDDLEIRFPLAHKKDIEKQSNKEKINPAWAFAVIRQESAFTTDARSSTGALGLMQLMPRTARQVAHSLRIKRPQQHDLLKTKVNIKIGIRYLRKLSQGFAGNTVLATAAYNAGRSRVKGWLPKEEAQPADLWIENVPFTETRKYLKRVLTYTVIYEQRLGINGKPLLERMMPIAIKKGKL